MKHYDFNTLIFDLGDVVLNWSPSSEAELGPKKFKSMVASVIWHDYERARFSEQKCYEKLASKFAVAPAAISNAVVEARKRVSVNQDIVSLLKELKRSSPELKVFAASNMSSEDYDHIVRNVPIDWSLFDDVIVSSAIGMRKPDMKFYNHLVRQLALDPSKAIFVDDNLDNVISARVLGMHGIIFKGQSSLTRDLYNLLMDPVQRGFDWLDANIDHLNMIGDTGVLIPELFSEMYIVEATGEEKYYKHKIPRGIANFFYDTPVLTNKDFNEFPDDGDTTAVALTVWPVEDAIAQSVMDHMLSYVNEDGLHLMYFDYKRPRIDHVVLTNMLTFFHTYGGAHKITKTYDWIYALLLNRAYMDGTRYYLTPECFFYALSRLVQASTDPAVQTSLRPLLKERIQERIGADPTDVLAIAMRIVAADAVGIVDERDLRLLLPMQCKDGGWEIGWFYKYGVSGMLVGSRSMATAIAIQAIKCFEKSQDTNGTNNVNGTKNIISSNSSDGFDNIDETSSIDGTNGIKGISMVEGTNGTNSVNGTHGNSAH